MNKISTRTAYGEALAEIGSDPRIFVLDADLQCCTRTEKFGALYPERSRNVGIAEANMVGIAAGMATCGKIVFVNSFAMFTAGRAFEQIRNSIGYPHLNVKICASHAGLTVGEDGASHQCIEDIGLMRLIPGMMVVQPCDCIEAEQVIKEIVKIDGPCYVRLGRNAVDAVNDESYRLDLFKGVTLRKGSKVAVIATGQLVQEALKAYDMVEEKPTVINIHTIKPIDEELITETARTHDVIITAEDHSVIGGLGSAVLDVLADKGLGCRVHRIGVQDVFGESGKPAELLHKYQMDADAIAAKIREVSK